MNRQIKKVITQHIKLMEMIIQSNWKVGDKTARPEIPDILQILNISYSGIRSYRTNVIKIEWAKKSIRVDNNP